MQQTGEWRTEAEGQSTPTRRRRSAAVAVFRLLRDLLLYVALPALVTVKAMSALSVSEPAQTPYPTCHHCNGAGSGGRDNYAGDRTFRGHVGW